MRDGGEEVVHRACGRLCLGARPALGVVHHRALDGEGDAIARELEELHLVAAERPRVHTADVEDAHEPGLHRERNAGERPDGLVAHVAAHHVLVVDVVEDDGPALRRDPSREALADRDPDGSLRVVLEAERGAHHERAVGLGQQDDHGVGGERALDAGQQLAEQLLEGEAREGGVGDRLDAADELRGRLGLGARRLLGGEQPATLVLDAPPVGDVADVRREGRRPVGGRARHRQLDGELRAAGAHGIDLDALADDPTLTRPAVLLEALLMPLAQGGRDDDRRQRSAEDLGPRVAEHSLRGRVELGDPSRRIRRDDGVERRVEEDRTLGVEER